MEININRYRVDGKKEFNLKDYPNKEPEGTDEEYIRNEIIPPLVDELKDLHLKLFAQEKQGIIVVLQAMDAAGKDEAISYIFSNLNAQGLITTSFGKPSEEEQKHDYMWRLHPGIPARGEISLLNRSYYEDVIVTQVHDLLEEKDKNHLKDENIWKTRYRQIKDQERYFEENGIHVIKFFFNMSKDVQKERLLERMKNPDKNWEFSFNDVKEREHWEDYYQVFEEMIDATSTPTVPWYVLPADDPWYTRAIITTVMVETLKSLNPQFPKITDEEQETLNEYIKKLENEK